MDVMDAVDGALDNVKNAMDNAIQRINKEIRLQKLKSDSMCRLKTAHNWQEEKEQNVVDLSRPSFFWRAHTGTVLLLLICCLVYKGSGENILLEFIAKGPKIQPSKLKIKNIIILAIF